MNKAFWLTLSCLVFGPLLTGHCQQTKPIEGSLEIPKVAVPAADAVKAARQKVRELFAAEFKQAKVPDQRWQLATKLSKDAAESTDDPATAYALAMESADLFVVDGDVLSAFKTVDQLAQTFVMDALTTKVGLFKRAAKEAKAVPVKRSMAGAGLKLAADAAAAEQYVAASELATLSATLARPSRDTGLVKRATEQQARLSDLAKLAQKVADARDKLKTDDADPEANERVGRYLCLTRQKWDEGLPFLVKGADAGLKAAAEMDLQLKTEPAAQAATANAWWQLADKKKDLEKQQLMPRVAYWYEQALPGLGALERVDAEKRLNVAYEAMSNRDFRRITAGAANGLQAKGPLDCAQQPHLAVLGKTFDSRQSWMASMQFNAPDFDRADESHHLLSWGERGYENPLYITLERNRVTCVVADGINRRAQGIDTYLDKKLVKQWVDIKFVFDSVTQELELYVDHRLVQKEPATLVPQTNQRFNVILGGSDDPDVQRFFGQLRNVWFGNIK